MINNLYAEKIQSDAGMQGLACLDLILLARWLGTTPFEPCGWRRADGASLHGSLDCWSRRDGPLERSPRDNGGPCRAQTTKLGRSL
jgi:hypothetical protein